MKLIGHTDADCFYCSAERVRFPHLKRMPMAVLGNHGACVITKSYEAKAAGVQTGMPIWEAVKLCPDAIYVKRDFRWYETISRRMLEILKHTSPRVEYYSIDEMFFIAQEGTTKAAHDLQQHILQRVGVPVSVGIAPTKILAKLATGRNKPFGVHVVRTDSDRLELLDGLPVEKITGIASRSAAKLANYGIRTCDQFAAADRRLIRQLLTKTGEDLWWELRGESVIEVSPVRPRNKMIARGGSLGRATADMDRLRAFTVRNTERLIEALNHYQLGCDQLILDLSFKPVGRGVLRENLMATSWNFEELALAALRLLERLLCNGGAIHYMHVIAAKLRSRGDAQPSLFSLVDERREAIDKVKHDINEKLGRFVLRSGVTMALADVYADIAQDYDICDVYGKSCF